MGSGRTDRYWARIAGLWSAVGATVFSLLYVVLQLAEWLGWLGSAGGPEASSGASGLVLLLTPSLLLAPCFLVLMVSVHSSAPPERALWGRIAVAFATIYAALVGLVYFVQLALVVPRMEAGRTADIDLLLFRPFDSFLYAVDILGYTCMSLAMLAGAGAIVGGYGAAAARRLFAATGLLFPFLVFQMAYRPLIYAASLWGLLFPAATALLAVRYARALRGGDAEAGPCRAARSRTASIDA